jgi:hypothetical protein
MIGFYFKNVILLVLDRIFNYRVPISSFEYSKKNIIVCDFEDCKFKHNMFYFYSLNPKPFHIYPSETNHTKKGPRNCGPVFCCCSTFMDLAYCHHILAINSLNIANKVLDPIYI